MSEIPVKDLERVKALVSEVIGEGSIAKLERLGGLTNHTYHAVMEDGGEYVVRLPGEGTEELIVRSDEKISTELACELGVDSEMLYFGSDGSKISRYIKNAVTMSKDSLKDPLRIKQMADIFIKLHDSGKDTKIPFEVFDMAEGYEKIISDLKVPMFDDYEENKIKVMAIKAEVDKTVSAKKVPCHNDALCENWVVGDDRMYLIDWEYAGMNDGMWDLADVSIEAEFEREHDITFLSAYLKREPTVGDMKHFLASKIYVDFLWTLWAKARVPYSGQAMEDWAVERYARLKENIRAFEAL